MSPEPAETQLSLLDPDDLASFWFPISGYTDGPFQHKAESAKEKKGWGVFKGGGVGKTEDLEAK